MILIGGNIMIPKKIHYCWFGGKKIPKDVKKCIKSWKKYCPDYEIIEWNESNFDVRSSQFLSDAYDENAWAFVSDYARLKIIYDNGGIYLDTDVELLKSLDSILENESYFGIQQQENYVNTGLGFGATKNHYIVKDMLDFYDTQKFDISEKMKLSCPLLNTEILKKYGFSFEIDKKIYKLADGNVTVYASMYLDPIAPGNTENLLCSDTFSIHHYSASWTSKKNILKRRLIRIIGQKKINRLKKIFRR